MGRQTSDLRWKSGEGDLAQSETPTNMHKIVTFYKKVKNVEMVSRKKHLNE